MHVTTCRQTQIMITTNLFAPTNKPWQQHKNINKYQELSLSATEGVRTTTSTLVVAFYVCILNSRKKGESAAV